MRAPAARSLPTRNRRRCLEAAARGAFALCLAVLHFDARAQWSGSVTLASDYRYRGVSLTGNDPAAQATVNYDDPSGFYAGAFLSNVHFAFSSGRELQVLGFVGYAQRLSSGASIDGGVDYSSFTRTHDYDYPEFHLGFASGNISGRLYYTPRYFGRFGNAVYGELNLAQPLNDRFRLIAHGGVLHSGSYASYGGSDGETTFDARIGIGADFKAFDFELSWVGVTKGQSAYPFAGNGRRNGVVVTLTHSF